MLLVGAGFVQLFLPYNKIADLVFASLGCVVFSLYIVYDTWLIQRRLSPEDWVLANVSLYVSLSCLLPLSWLCFGQLTIGGRLKSSHSSTSSTSSSISFAVCLTFFHEMNSDLWSRQNMRAGRAFGGLCNTVLDTYAAQLAIPLLFLAQC